MKQYIFLAALSAPLISQADTWIDISLGSMHNQDTYLVNGEVNELNESNPGIGIAYKHNDNVEFIGGAYKNSFDVNSVYAGADFHTSSKRPVRLGISTGLITGYEYPVAAMPNIVFSNDKVRVKIGAFPPYQDSPGAITFSVGIKL